jgi:hypothetical protein
MLENLGWEASSPLIDNSEDFDFSMLAVLCRTGRADNHFRLDLLSLATWIGTIFFLGLLRRLFDHDDICAGTIGVHLAAVFHNKAMTRSTRRHDAPTQLTTKHGTSRCYDLREGSNPDRLCTSQMETEQENLHWFNMTSADESRKVAKSGTMSNG